MLKAERTNNNLKKPTFYELCQSQTFLAKSKYIQVVSNQVTMQTMSGKGLHDWRQKCLSAVPVGEEGDAFFF